MSLPLPEELAELRRSVHGILTRHWPEPGTAGAGDHDDRLARLWDAAAGAGWTGLGPAGSLSAAAVVAFELGRAGCPLPVGDVFAAAQLLEQETGLLAAVEAGTVRPVAVPEEAVRGGAAFPVEAAAAATHAVILPNGGGTARVIVIDRHEPLTGLAVPPWSRITLGDEVGAVSVDRDASDDSRAVLRLCLAASALGAASAAHDHALGHARERHQFGRPIGAFQAVAHRLADAAIDVAGGRLLLDEAAAACDLGPSSWRLSAALATRHALTAAPRVQRAAHHTLAAGGYFEDHPAPWLFRRVHADVGRSACFPLQAGGPFDMLLEGRAALPALELGETGERARASIRQFLTDHPARPGGGLGDDDPDFVAALARHGFLASALGPGWGGRRATVEELVAVHEELAYHRAPARTAVAAVTLFGPAIEQFGSPDQQARFLPLLAEGRLRFYLGYSEPEVGSDLASLSTRAVRDGDEWVITGQKSWGTGADRAEWVWLAARTDPDADPPRNGITVFLFPTGLPGWEAHPHRALSGEVSCSTFFDGVRVPDTARIGPVNGGWAVITTALAAERVVMAAHIAELRRQLDDLLAVLRADPAPAGPRGSAVRARWDDLVVRLQLGRVLFRAGVAAMAAGGGGWVEAPMAKVVTGDLAEDFGAAALATLGPSAALGAGQPGAVGDGWFEFGLRLAPMYVIGGGTADIQRNLIARGLGLPRAS